MESKIDGVEIKHLRMIPDERGTIMHMLRCDDPIFEKFGEIYFSVAYPNIIKGWHLHKTMTLNYAVIFGMVKLVLYDMREGSATKNQLEEMFIGERNYVLVKIPPGILNGYKTIGEKPSILANCATEVHNPSEMVRIDPFDKSIPYDWTLKNR